MNLVVAISAFRSDAAVLGLLEELYSGSYPEAKVVVVCSCGGRELEREILERGYPDCQVLPFEENLGSAGNLYQRFQAACALGADCMLALNHDAVITPAMVRALLDAMAHARGRVGACYPLRYTPGKGMYDLSGVEEVPFRFVGQADAPGVESIDVVWSSSNGALYALAPLREDGLVPDRSLWMGWEDYQYGLQLRAAGWRQRIVVAARMVDDYEYRTIRRFGRLITLSDKPLWYSYYAPRNLVLIGLHKCRAARRIPRLVRWLLAYPLQILLARDGPDRLRALKYYFTGVLHGFMGRAGKWRLP